MKMGYKLFTVNAGHSAKAPGASGNGYKEHEVARKIKDKVIVHLKAVGMKAVDTTSNAATKNAVLAEQAKKCNALPKAGRLDVSIHLNATPGGTGCEVYYYSEKALADKVSAAIAAAGGFKDRNKTDDKERKDFYFLKNTEAPAILIEVCFIDNKDDMKKLNSKMDEIAKAIVKALTGKTVSEPKQTPPKKKESGPLYKVQTGAFANEENAKRYADQLKKKGIKTHIIKG
jgi:N-acetylmuramoyl-L-alanine amidase